MNTQITVSETVNELVKMTLTVEQGDYIHEASFTFNALPCINDVANITLNEVYSFLAVQKMLVSSKNRPSLAQPFTFAICFEQGDKSAILSDFSTKVSFGEKAQEKLLKNMPAVIAQLLVSKTISFKDRQAAIANPNSIVLVLS